MFVWGGAPLHKARNSNVAISIVASPLIGPQCLLQQVCTTTAGVHGPRTRTHIVAEVVVNIICVKPLHNEYVIQMLLVRVPIVTPARVHITMRMGCVGVTCGNGRVSGGISTNSESDTRKPPV